MARVDEAPEDRDKLSLRLSQIWECPACGTEQDVDFVAPEGVYDAEDLTDPPEAEHSCEYCSEFFVIEYSGWTVHQDAG